MKYIEWGWECHSSFYGGKMALLIHSPPPKTPTLPLQVFRLNRYNTKLRSRCTSVKAIKSRPQKQILSTLLHLKGNDCCSFPPIPVSDQNLFQEKGSFYSTPTSFVVCMCSSQVWQQHSLRHSPGNFDSEENWGKKMVKDVHHVLFFSPQKMLKVFIVQRIPPRQRMVGWAEAITTTTCNRWSLHLFCSVDIEGKICWF